MGRPCTICAHPQRAEIDVALQGGASLDDVVVQFALSSRSALQRHRASHLGRAVSFTLPVISAQLPGAAHAEGSAPLDSSAELDRLFARAAVNTRSLQEHAALVTDGLAHVYAAAATAGDWSSAVRALRELRGILQFHALVSPEKLRQHPGWREEEVPRDPIVALERLLLAQMTGEHAEIEAARAELEAVRMGAGSITDLPEDPHAFH
ncbi:hypothetical protein [Methylobacterium sp. Leaf123]|uniref:hypothetical protein n=1 Tax=Methylobacterium sp. Leaf123 TaxID=1736264 RepID=UPI0012E7EFB0|nr:hypothetical protein [Methylobacterium sp. Leaf123]